MSQSSNDWEYITTLTKGDENSDAVHPLGDLESFEEIKDALAKLEVLYKKNYDELRLKYYFRTLGYGATTQSWALEGRYTDNTKRLLYGKPQ